MLSGQLHLAYSLLTTTVSREARPIRTSSAETKPTGTAQDPKSSDHRNC